MYKEAGFGRYFQIPCLPGNFVCAAKGPPRRFPSGSRWSIAPPHFPASVQAKAPGSVGKRGREKVRGRMRQCVLTISRGLAGNMCTNGNAERWPRGARPPQTSVASTSLRRGCNVYASAASRCWRTRSTIFATDSSRVRLLLSSSMALSAGFSGAISLVESC